jgi:hypothetical protein
MGPKLFDLPILLALAYLGMGYLSWVLAVVILGCQNGQLSGRKIVLLPLTASVVMTGLGLFHGRGLGRHRSRLGVARLRLVLWSADEQLLGLVFHCLHFLSAIRVVSQKPSDHPIAAKLLASRYLVLCRVRSGESPGCGPLVSGRRLRGRCRQTVGHPRHSLGISPGLHLFHDAPQSDGLGQSLQTSRTILETGSSGCSKRVTGKPEVFRKLVGPGRRLSNFSAEPRYFELNRFNGLCGETSYKPASGLLHPVWPKLCPSRRAGPLGRSTPLLGVRCGTWGRALLLSR